MLRKRMFIVILFISMVFTTGLSTFSLNSNIVYSDIEGHWAQHMIEEFTQRGYLVGYSDGTFRPDYPITRAEAGAFVSRLGFPELYPEIVYSDLMEGTWYYNHVIAATKTGFVHGYPDVTYRPDIFILREEATKLASHFWGEVDMAGYELAFSDKDSISDWSFNHLEKLCKMTLLDGYPDNTIRPKANLTRAEFVKLFYLILIEPKYANITVRAVDSNNESYDLVEPKVFSYEIGSEITLSSPDISYPWQLLGDITKTLMVEGETEILFKYYYYTPPANVGGVTQTTYSLSLSTIPSMETATLTGAGIYLANTTVPVSAPEVEGYSFTGWYRQEGEGSTLISNNRSFNYPMPSSNTLLVAHYNVTSTGDCFVPTLIAHSNYDVDQILTITYEEEDNEFEEWRNNIDRIEIRQLLGGEGIGDPQLFTLETIDLPDAKASIDTPGVLTLDPAQIEVLQDAGANYIIVVITEGGCETEVTQYVQAGAVYSLSYLPYRGITIDFSGQIYPGAIADYNETPFETTLIEVFLIDQYGNTCGSGPSYGAIVYAEAAWDDTGDPGDLGWVLSSQDPNNPSLPANQAAVQGVLGYAEFNELKRAGAGLNYCYITFKVYKPGQPHDGTGDSVTKNTALFVLPPVN